MKQSNIPGSSGSSDKGKWIESGSEKSKVFPYSYDMIPTKQNKIQVIELGTKDPQEVLNDCLEKIGMGRYQWQLFVLCGLGWAADNMLFNLLAVIATQINYEYNLQGLLANITTTLGYFGMAIGAMVWGYISDIIGRRTAFMWTFVITGLFCVLSGFGNSTWSICVLIGFMGLGFGGNLPIDGALFLECVPPSRQAMLTLMSLFWPIGGVVTALVGWGFLGFLPDSACASAENCTYEMNRGWRYCVFALGGLTLAMCLGRYLFPLQESPKYYIARGKYHEAVKVLKWLARNNNVELHVEAKDFESTPEMQELIEKRKQSAVERFKPLFGKELVLTTILIWFIWMFVNIGYNMFNGFLPFFLANAGADVLTTYEVYRNYVIINIVSVPGSILGWKLTDSNFGRKGTLAAATFGTSLSIVLFTVFTSSTGQLICSCIVGFLQNIMFGVVYAYTPEVFPTYIRVSAYGIAAAFGSWAGVLAPLLTTSLQSWGIYPPLYLCASLIFMVGVCALLLPIETRGRDSV